MPATAAIDNETLDHLLSVVDDSRNVKCVARIWKRNSCMFRKGSPGDVKCGNRSHQNSDGRVARMKPLCAVLMAGWLASFAGDDCVRAQDLVSWRQGVVRPKADAGFWWMTAEGGFARRQGLDMKMIAFDSDVDMVKALRAGELDGFEGSPINPMVATSMGGDLKIIGCTWPKLTFSFFAHPGIGSLADLAGKIIGISVPGALPDLVTRAMLGRVAIEPRDVKFV